MTMDGGEELGPYRLRTLLGRGGMGEVFQANDVVQDREVAVKRLLAHMANDPEFQRRFKRESRAAARLRNPYVACGRETVARSVQCIHSTGP